MKVFDQSIRQFIEAACSASPTPGGGSVAAVSAALGASMGSMVASLSTGTRFEKNAAQMNTIIEQIKTAIDEFEQIAKQDMESFRLFMDALKMPKDTDEKRAQRSECLQQAAIQAANVPLRLMTQSRDIMALLEKASQIYNKNVISDLGVAVITLDAAIQSAWLTVKINLSSIKNEKTNSNYEKQGMHLLNDVQKIKQSVMNVVMDKIG
ncbi:cyclodeaminase/cyclohydrolase family protein [Sporolactobacillus terrae]|uniref:cyclodeaminase/cyclohydrolase family protein n=1 Tax=Sporolactobacillus terrae TaxID=269673 RepID=UPI00048E5EAF|nr:cyclodeaminase/cyclohydrolase family protein [Sporolactobacillus terrae]